MYYTSDIFGDALETSALLTDTNVIDFVEVSIKLCWTLLTQVNNVPLKMF